MKHRHLLALGLWLAIAGAGSRAHAWPRSAVEDYTLVERSELIVVGHMVEGSTVYVPHDHKPGEGASWEYHATLKITEVLKGKSDKVEIPIIIHYGLAPAIDGHVKGENFDISSRASNDMRKDGAIEIIDTGGMLGAVWVKDARQDNLWFLRKRSGPYGWEPGTGKYGIVDPQDVQPLTLKDYFLAYLADDPEREVRKHAQQNPEVTERANEYLGHLEVQRALKLQDPEERFRRLLPFILNPRPTLLRFAARDGIVACGKKAAAPLMKIYDDPVHGAIRDDIMMMWRDMEYRETVPVLDAPSAADKPRR